MRSPSRYRSLAVGTASHFLRVAAPAIACIMTGCREPARTAPLFTPMRQAIAIVEANRALIDAGLKARGSVRGHFRDSDGTRRHFDLDARLQVVPPDHMRIVMEHALAGEEFEAGMNREKWWLWVLALLRSVLSETP